MKTKTHSFVQLQTLLVWILSATLLQGNQDDGKVLQPVDGQQLSLACRKPLEDFRQISIEHKTKGVILAEWVGEHALIYLTDAEFSMNATHVIMNIPSYDNSYRGLIHCQSSLLEGQIIDEFIQIGSIPLYRDSIKDLIKSNNEFKCCSLKGNISEDCAKDLCSSSQNPQIITTPGCTDVGPEAFLPCTNTNNVGSSVSCCQSFGMPIDKCLDLCTSTPDRYFSQPSRYKDCAKYSQIIFSCKSIFIDEPNISIQTIGIDKGTNHLIFWDFPRSNYTESYTVSINNQLLTLTSVIKPWFVIETSSETLLTVQVSGDSIYGASVIGGDSMPMRNNIILEPIEKNKTYTKVESLLDVKSCCETRNIPLVCQQHLCLETFPANFHSEWITNGLCLNYLVDALNCHYSESDSYSCCQKNGVGYPCNRFCSYMADTMLSSSDISCLGENLNSISQCLETLADSEQTSSVISEKTDSNKSYSKSLLITGSLKENNEPLKWSSDLNDFASKRFQDIEQNLCRTVLFKMLNGISFITCSLVRFEESPVRFVMHQIAAVPVSTNVEILDILSKAYMNSTRFGLDSVDISENIEDLGEPPGQIEVESYAWENETTLFLELKPTPQDVSRVIYLDSHPVSFDENMNHIRLYQLKKHHSYLIGLQNINKFGVSNVEYLKIAGLPEVNITGTALALVIALCLVITLIVFSILSIYFTKHGFPIGTKPGSEKIMKGYARVFKIRPFESRKQSPAYDYCDKILPQNGPQRI